MVYPIAAGTQLMAMVPKSSIALIATCSTETSHLKTSTTVCFSKDSKGTLDEDTSHSVNRAANYTRPLGLKSTDNKIYAGVSNQAVTPTINKWAEDTHSSHSLLEGRASTMW